VSEQPTRYTFEITCDDIGEYDAIWMSQVAASIAELLGATGVIDYTVRTARRRPGPFS
jgi:hypothetical protein